MQPMNNLLALNEAIVVNAWKAPYPDYEDVIRKYYSLLNQWFENSWLEFENHSDPNKFLDPPLQYGHNTV